MTEPPPAATDPAVPAPRRPAWRRWWPLAALVVATALVFALDLDRFVTFDALRQHRAVLQGFVERHGVLALLALVLAYTAVVALSVPGAVVMTVAAGFLFGTALGGALAVIGATAGATLVFLLARSALRAPLAARAGPFVRRMEEGFRRDAFSYLLVLRLVPLFPFWLVNLVPAVLGVPARVFVAATLIGIVPGTFVFASVGAGLGSVLDSDQPLSPGSVLTPKILLALGALAVLALVPVVYRRLKGRRR
ncbi:MAG: TVP38/TMEM64 family protein [Alphaproteobacteria bacterium]|nr:TVP38/TMEM64 family protein [Alphaproteobacteria bacterium]